MTEPRLLERRGGVGRLPKLTPSIQAKLVEVLRAGNYLDTACHLARTPQQTINNWLRQGEDDVEAGRETGYGAFFAAIKDAMSAAEQDALRIVRNHSNERVPGEWTAAAWFLERRYPSKWGKRDQLAVKTDLTVHIQVGSALPSQVFGAFAGRGGGEIVDIEPSESPELPELPEGLE